MKSSQHSKIKVSLLAVLFFFGWQFSEGDGRAQSRPRMQTIHPTQNVLHLAAGIIPYQSGFPRREPGAVDFSSPSVVDLQGDGHLEVLVGGYGGCVWGWKADGSLLNGYPLISSGNRCNNERIGGPLAIGDADGNGQLEIAAGTRGENIAGERGKVYVWNGATGQLLPGWPIEMPWSSASTGPAEVTTVALGNLAGDGNLEVMAGTTNSGGSQPTPNVLAWRLDGSWLEGFPTAHRNGGIWGAIAVADIFGDSDQELIVGRDQKQLDAYDSHGQQLPGWPVSTYVDGTKTNWEQDLYIEFTYSAPSIADLDRDGAMDLIFAGKVRDPLQGGAITHYGLFVLQPDGSRRPGWEIARLAGPPLTSIYSSLQAAAVADLDGNGRSEIVMSFPDGTLRVYDDVGNARWVFDYAQEKILLASEPVIGDINADGQVEIVFGVYSPPGTDAETSAGVAALDANGQLLAGFPLSLTQEESIEMAGIRAAPTLADLDGDCDVEIIAASLGGSVYVWDLPARYYPDRMPWPTGRHDNARSGSVSGAPLFTSQCPLYHPLTRRVYLPQILHQK